MLIITKTIGNAINKRRGSHQFLSILLTWEETIFIDLLIFPQPWGRTCLPLFRYKFFYILMTTYLSTYFLIGKSWSIANRNVCIVNWKYLNIFKVPFFHLFYKYAILVQWRYPRYNNKRSSSASALEAQRKKIPMIKVSHDRLLVLN